MTNLINVISAIFIAVQFPGLECNPTHLEKEINGVQRSLKVFKPDTKEWTHFHHSWGLPHFPSLTSVSSFFQDEDDKARIDTKERLDALEKNQKEILAMLQKLSEKMSATKDQSTLKPLSEKPQNPPSLNDKRPTPESSIEKQTTTKSIEMKIVSSTAASNTPSTARSTIPSSAPPSVSSAISSTVPSTVSSTSSSTTVTRVPVAETSTVQETIQQPQTPSNTNSNLDSNTGDNQELAATAASQENSSAPGPNFGSIVALSSDGNENAAAETESTV